MSDANSTTAPEVWKPVPGFEGHYEVSSLGNVGSLKSGERRVLKLSLNGCGYLQVGLSGKGNGKTFRVHHVVAMAFLGPKPDGLWVLHRDDVRTNNAASNLYYGTPSQNALDRNKNGNYTQPRGSAHSRAALNESLVSEILDLFHRGHNMSELSRRFNVTRAAIHSILDGSTWNHVPRSHELKEVLADARLSEEIARARKEAGLSQRELAARLNLNKRSIGRMEEPDYCGHGMKTLRRIAAALGKRLEVRFVDFDPGGPGD